MGDIKKSLSYMETLNHVRNLLDELILERDKWTEQGYDIDEIGEPCVEILDIFYRSENLDKE